MLALYIYIVMYNIYIVYKTSRGSIHHVKDQGRSSSQIHIQDEINQLYTYSAQHSK